MGLEAQLEASQHAPDQKFRCRPALANTGHQATARLYAERIYHVGILAPRRKPFGRKAIRARNTSTAAAQGRALLARGLAERLGVLADTPSAQLRCVSASYSK